MVDKHTPGPIRVPRQASTGPLRIAIRRQLDAGGVAQPLYDLQHRGDVALGDGPQHPFAVDDDDPVGPVLAEQRQRLERVDGKAVDHPGHDPFWGAFEEYMGKLEEEE